MDQALIPNNGASFSDLGAYELDPLAPVLTTSAGATSALEQTATVIDAGITVTDPISPTLDSATVTITGNFQTGEDVLGFVNDGSTMGDIVGSYNPATGELTLTSAGGATPAELQAALQAVTYTDTSDTPDTGSRTISFGASDGFATSTFATKTVSVTPVNDAPVVTAGNVATYDAQTGTPVVIDPTVTVSDVDSATLSGATVVISAGLKNGDVLNFTDQAGITGTYDAATGVLTLTGNAAPAAYQTALASITFSTSDRGGGQRTVTWTVDDGGAANNLSNPQISTVAATAASGIRQVPDHLPAQNVFEDNTAGTSNGNGNSGPVELTTNVSNTAPPSLNIDFGTGYHYVNVNIQTLSLGNALLQLQVPLASLSAPLGGDVVAVTATLLDGSSLPSWLTFNPDSGTLVADLPLGIVASVEPNVGNLPSDAILTGSIPGLGRHRHPAAPLARADFGPDYGARCARQYRDHDLHHRFQAGCAA